VRGCHSPTQLRAVRSAGHNPQRLLIVAPLRFLIEIKC
jgi:hypothetical protein